jgi:hypothetical protein
MTAPDALPYARIPLIHGSGAIPALGFGTLIPDPLATKQATKTASHSVSGKPLPKSCLPGRAVQRGTAFLTTSVTPARIQENFELSTLPEDTVQEIRDGVATRIRFNTVVETGVPGFIPRSR